ncbi:MAG: hypothetical protein LUQ47_01400 [Methanotrichaceae archaeon]|nr:hypothetical protein [Methanotrichaceae archaeon]
MKAFITGLCILLVIGLVFQQAAASGIATLGSPGTMSGIGVQRMEEKMAQALQGLGLKQPVPAVAAAGPQREMPINDTDELNISAAEFNNATKLNLTENETALEFESKDVVIDVNESNPAESMESEILAEVSAMNTSEIDAETEPEESAEQAVSESSTMDLAQSNMTGGESKALNDSAANITKINANNMTAAAANMTTIDTNMTKIAENMTTINISSENLLPFNASTVNLTINATGLNSTALNLSNSTNVPCKSCSNKAGQNIGDSTSAAVNGFWGMQSGQHTIGGTDIKSNTFLSGDFEVDKGVKFQDRGF